MEVIEYRLEEVVPSERSVYAHQGIPGTAKINDGIAGIYLLAMEMFEELCEPVVISKDVTVEQFAEIVKGENLNEADAPLDDIYPHAGRLTLYALTMGVKLSDRIKELFDSDDFPLAVMLDSVASMAADKASDVLDARIEGDYNTEGHFSLGYSPGYCGWHISGQKRLFEFLKPERIGMSLNDSYLMTPIKSVSGVVVSGPAESHIFKPNFAFCHRCRTHSCYDRLRAMKRYVFEHHGTTDGGQS